MRATRAVIYQDSIRENILTIKSLVKPETKLCVAVKADGYGCGAVTAARIAEAAGAEYLAVATAEEGAELRENGITAEILLLGLCAPEDFPLLIECNVTPTLFDSEYIGAFADAAGRKAATGGRRNVFLAVDTGMGRIGCRPEEAADRAAQIAGSGSLRLGGMMTHFAAADSTAPDDRAYTARQFRSFQEAVGAVRKRGIEPGIRTCANSAAILDAPELQLDMVRPGIIVYGCYPGQITERYLDEKGTPVRLKQVMQLETQVVSLRRFRKGQSASYGRTWTAERDTVVAVLPVGYADGLLRRCVPGLRVAIRGRSYPVCGRICMDQCMVDVGPEPDVERWDTAVLFGSKERGALADATDIAELTGTISYEVLASVSKRVPRVLA